VRLVWLPLRLLDLQTQDGSGRGDGWPDSPLDPDQTLVDKPIDRSTEMPVAGWACVLWRARRKLASDLRYGAMLHQRTFTHATHEGSHHWSRWSAVQATTAFSLGDVCFDLLPDGNVASIHPLVKHVALCQRLRG
jgi:hypothetical protein